LRALASLAARVAGGPVLLEEGDHLVDGDPVGVEEGVVVADGVEAVVDLVLAQVPAGVPASTKDG
jgi:hypothetical protein